MKSNRNKILVISIALLSIVNIIFIFSNSIPSIPESRETSEQILEIVEPILDNLVGEGNVTNHFVRKCAHVVEFFCLGTLLATFFLLVKRTVLWSCQIGLLTALTDETIQLHTQRGAQLQDVWLDFASVVVSVMIVWTVNRIYNYYTKKP